MPAAQERYYGAWNAIESGWDLLLEFDALFAPATFTSSIAPLSSATYAPLPWETAAPATTKQYVLHASTLPMDFSAISPPASCAQNSTSIVKNAIKIGAHSVWQDSSR